MEEAKPKRSAPKREMGLIKGTLVYFVGSMGTSVLQFFIVPIITRQLRAEEYAYFDLAYNAILVLIPVLTLQSMEALFRMLIGASPRDRPAYISTVGALCAAGIAGFGALLVFGTWLFDFIQYPWLLFLYFTGSVAYFYYQKIARCFGANTLYMTMGVLHTVTLLGLQLALLLVFHMTTEALLIAGAAAPFVAALGFEWKLKVRQYLSVRAVKKETARAVLAFSAPLIPQSVSVWSVTQVNRYIMVAALGMTVVGVYNMAYKFSFVLYAMTSVFQLAWQESAIRQSGAEGDKAFYAGTFAGYMRFIMTMLLIILPVTPYIVPFMLGSEFIGAARYIPLVYLISLFEAFMVFMSTGYLVSQRTVGSFVTVLWGSAFNILFVLVLVRPLGAYAALLGSVLSYALIWLLRIRDLKDVMPITVDRKLFAGLMLWIGAFTGAYYLLPIQWMPLAVLAGTALFFYYNWKMILAFWQSARGMLARLTSKNPAR